MKLEKREQQRVTLINTVPSAMEELVREGAISESVRVINLAGEPLSAALVDKIYAGSRGVSKVYDLYGPSEDTTYSTYVLRRKQGRASIGRPIANTQVYILDAQQQPVPVGVAGELHIAGEGLARGYRKCEELTEEELRRHVQQSLPEYMVPVAFRSLGAIPLNANGKVDRRALEGMEVKVGSGEEYVAPKSEVERQLVAIWGEVLKREAETIGRRDNFFQLGGHSLLAVRMIARVRQVLQAEVPIREVFARPVLADFARALESATRSVLPTLEPVDRRQMEGIPLSYA